MDVLASACVKTTAPVSIITIIVRPFMLTNALVPDSMPLDNMPSMEDSRIAVPMSTV